MTMENFNHTDQDGATLAAKLHLATDGGTPGVELTETDGGEFETGLYVSADALPGLLPWLHNASAQLGQPPLNNPATGLNTNFVVARLDGQPVGWAFVLEDTDPFAIPALEAYALAADLAGYGPLAADLRAKVAEMRAARGLPTH